MATFFWVAIFIESMFFYFLTALDELVLTFSISVFLNELDKKITIICLLSLTLSLIF